MKIVANIKIRNKLVLMLLFPLLAVLYFSVNGAWDKWGQAREMDTLLSLSELAVKTSAVVHEAQKERGMTALFLGSKGTKFQAELAEQHKATDTRTAALAEYLRKFDRARFGVSFGTSLDEALGRVDKTGPTRAAVTSVSIAAPEAIGHYTGMISSLLTVISRTTHLSGQGDLTRGLAAYVNFLQAKERTGIERALLSNTFAQDKFGPGMYERFVAVVSAQDTYTAGFEALASDDDRDFARKTVAGRASDEVARMRTVAREKAATGGFETDATYWFKTMTDKINQMKQVEDRLSDGLVARATAGRQRAWAALFAFVLIGIAAVAAALVMAYALVRSITRSVNTVLETMRELAEGEGDLTHRLAVAGRDELGQLSLAFNTFMDKLHSIIRQVRDAAMNATTASQQLSAAGDQLASGAQEQASSLEQTAASLEEITGTVKQTADNARQASQVATGSRDVADKGGKVVATAVDAMGEINRASKKIADIITTIDEIAFQTNLLALNAAVEAARAGEQGRGFAVVASEVRNLAQRSATAAKEIKGLIQDSVGKVETGSALVNQSGQTLEEIVGSVKRVTDLIAEIAAASNEQSAGIDQVNKAVAQMDQVVQSNAAQTEELSSTARALAAEAGSLQSLVGRFKLESEESQARMQAQAAPVRVNARPPIAPPPVRVAVPETAGELVGAGAGAAHTNGHAYANGHARHAGPKNEGFEEF